MGFLPNGDLIIVSSLVKNYKLKDCKIYYYSYYSVENKRKCSQIYDIELTESLKHHSSRFQTDCFFVYQTKLFFINTREKLMFQWNLSTMTFDMQYFFDYDIGYLDGVVINKNQTLLALKTYIIKNYNKKYKFYVFSMETGTLISKYG